MFIALVHWRIKSDTESVKAFMEHWNTRNSISNRKGLIAEFVSDTLPMASFPLYHVAFGPRVFGKLQVVRDNRSLGRCRYVWQ
jgi:hypothetical protein